MALQIIVHGVVYDYIDTVCIDEIIYDVYQDQYDNVIYKVIDTTYQFFKVGGVP